MGGTFCHSFCHFVLQCTILLHFFTWTHLLRGTNSSLLNGSSAAAFASEQFLQFENRLPQATSRDVAHGNRWLAGTFFVLLASFYLLRLFVDQAYPLLRRHSRSHTRPTEGVFYTALGQCLADMGQVDLAMVYYEIAVTGTFSKVSFREIATTSYIALF